MTNIDVIDNFVFLLPEILTLFTACFLVMAGVFTKESSALKVSHSAIILVSFTALVSFLFIPLEQKFLFNETYISNSFTFFTKLIIFIASILALIIAQGANKVARINYPFEVQVLMVFSILGMFVMIAANDFLVLYMGIELMSLPLYVLASIRKNESRSAEAGLKYFVLGALASGILLYGISLIYGFTGTTNFNRISDIFDSKYSIETASTHVALIIGLVMVIVGFLFKVSAVPFHMWTPDVYEGSPTFITSFFAGAPKIASIMLFIRMLEYPFGAWIYQWQQVIIVASVLSMMLGAFAALRQTNIKRLMAYSSINNIGYILIGVAAGSPEGVQAVFIYSFIYIIATAGMFSCIIMMAKNAKEPTEQIDDLKGLSQTHPKMAFAIGVFMFSFTGIPPLAGFFGKFYIFMSAVEAELYILAVIGVVTSVVAAFYYIKIIKLMYFDEPVNKLVRRSSYELNLVASVTAIFNLLFFIAPTELIKNSTLIASLVY